MEVGDGCYLVLMGISESMMCTVIRTPNRSTEMYLVQLTEQQSNVITAPGYYTSTDFEDFAAGHFLAYSEELSPVSAVDQLVIKLRGIK